MRIFACNDWIMADDYAVSRHTSNNTVMFS